MNTNIQNIVLGEINLDIVFKKIKNVHLSVHPPLGRVTVSAPIWMDNETVRLFCISKLGWIRKQQAKLLSQKRETEREYIDRETHHFLGEWHLLKIIESETKMKVQKNHKTLELHIRPDANRNQKEELMHSWYRLQLKEIVSTMIVNLEERMNVKISEVCIRKMRTKWGTCNRDAWRVWLNTELAKKWLEFIEYVLIHEMVHMLERNHNEKFMSYMDMYLPNWRHLREQLNRTELGYVDWEY